MWEEKLPSGRVRFKARWHDPLTGRSGTVSTTADKSTRTTRSRAQQILADKAREQTAAAKASTIYTLGDIYDAYIADIRRTCKPSTARTIGMTTHPLIDAIGRDFPADYLAAPVIRKVLPDKPSTHNLRIRRAKALMRWAYRADMIADIAWIDKLRLLPDPERAAKLEDKYLEREELSALLDTMDDEQDRLLTEFLALTGLRIGEVIALRRDDVDMAARRIHVNKTYSSELQTVQTPKTATSRRDVVIQDELVSVIKGLINLADSYIVHSPLLIPSYSGGYLCSRTYQRHLESASERSIGRKITPHALRHTMTSLFAEAGVPLDVISRRLGHENSQITRDIYLHITERQAEKDAEVVSCVSLLHECSTRGGKTSKNA